MKDVGRRHAKTLGTDGARFGKGDKMRRITGVGTLKDIVRGVEQRGVAENDLLGRGSDKARGNKINAISDEKQKKPKGQNRLKMADQLLQGKKPSQMPSIDELNFKDLGYK